MRSWEPSVMVLALLEIPPRKGKKNSLEGLLAGYSTDSWSRLLFTLANMTKAPLHQLHKPCFIYFPSKKNLCASLLKLAGLRKSASWPLFWRNETTISCEWEGSVCASSSCLQYLSGGEQDDTSCRELPFNHGTWVWWQNSFEQDLYAGTQN